MNYEFNQEKNEILKKGKRYACNGSCNEVPCSGSFAPGTASPPTFRCLCGGQESSNCTITSENVTLTNSNQYNGLNVMSNITISSLIVIPYTIEIIQP